MELCKLLLNSACVCWIQNFTVEFCIRIWMCKLTPHESPHPNVRTHPCSPHYKPPQSLKLISHTPNLLTFFCRCHNYGSSSVFEHQISQRRDWSRASEHHQGQPLPKDCARHHQDSSAGGEEWNWLHIPLQRRVPGFRKVRRTIRKRNLWW